MYPPEPSTISDYFFQSVERQPNERALGYILNGECHWLTWQEVADRVQALAAMLRIAGISPGDPVAQVSENRHEWIITDLATHLIGAVHVPIHITLSAEQIADQITDSGAKLVFVSTRDLLAKFADRIPRDIAIKIHDDTPRLRLPPALPGVSSPAPQPRAPSPRRASDHPLHLRHHRPTARRHAQPPKSRLECRRRL